MKHLNQFFCLIVLTLLCASCSKEVSSDTESAVSSEVSLFECGHENLVHHPALAPTSTECGNIEYWQCAFCGKRFSDAAGEKELLGRVYTLPMRFVDPSFLSGYNPFLKSAGTKGGVDAALIASLADLAVTVAGLITSVVSYTQDCEELVKEMEKVTAKAQKNANDLQQIANITQDIARMVKELYVEMGDMSWMVDDMLLKLDEAKTLIRETRDIAIKALGEVESVEQNIRCENLFDKRYEDILALDSSSGSAWTAISDLLHSDGGALSMAKTALDSLDVIKLSVDRFCNVVSAWGSNHENAQLTSTLIERFLQMSAEPGSTYIKLLEDYCLYHFPWEHQSLEFKKMMFDYDFYVLTQSYSMAMAYYKCHQKYDEIYTSYIMNRMEENYYEIMDLITEKTAEYEDQYYNADRICYITGKVIDINAHPVRIETYLSNLIVPNDMSYSKGVVEYFWQAYYMGSTKEETSQHSIDDRDLELFTLQCTSNSIWDICFNLEAGGMGFKHDIADNLPLAVMVPFSDGEVFLTEYSNYGNGVIMPYYWYPVSVCATCRMDNLQPCTYELAVCRSDKRSDNVLWFEHQANYYTFNVKGSIEN